MNKKSDQSPSQPQPLSQTKIKTRLHLKKPAKGQTQLNQALKSKANRWLLKLLLPQKPPKKQV